VLIFAGGSRRRRGDGRRDGGRAVRAASAQPRAVDRQPRTRACRASATQSLLDSRRFLDRTAGTRGAGMSAVPAPSWVGVASRRPCCLRGTIFWPS